MIITSQVPYTNYSTIPGHIIYKNDDLIDATENVIAHGCNCEGYMHRGFANIIRLKYPKLFTIYAGYCKLQQFITGSVFVYKIDGKEIWNLATQKTRFSGARLKFIKQSLENAICNNQNEKIIAIPKIGCNYGKLNWELQVLPLLTKICKQYGVTFVVYSLDSPMLSKSDPI